jgi:hypothetical protein
MRNYLDEIDSQFLGYDQGIMGSIISTPYFLETVNLKASHSIRSRQPG